MNGKMSGRPKSGCRVVEHVEEEDGWTQCISVFCLSSYASCVGFGRGPSVVCISVNE